MQTVFLVAVAIPVLLVAAGLIASARFASRTGALRAELRTSAAPRDVAGALPGRVRDFALRADANPGDLARRIEFGQSVEMRLRRGAAWKSMTATQSVSAGAPGFVWLADQPLGPLPMVRVVDAFAGGKGLLQVMLFGAVRVARASGPEIDRAEAMRYLAELPWVPDAILGNPHLRWRMLDDHWAEVSLADPWVAVRFRFDAAGDIVEMFARDRPCTDESGQPSVRDWRGFFRDYRMIGPRRVPAEAEVGYDYPDGYRPYFQGRITGYGAVH